jgi:predicted KAP-like P-loop ATPase
MPTVPHRSVSHATPVDFKLHPPGEDLLERRELVERVVSTILLEAPSIIAVTGGYGDGKTSFLNLTIGELSKTEPIIVRFSHGWRVTRTPLFFHC